MSPETSQSTWIYEALAWFELNRKRVIAGAAVVLGIVVAGYVYDWHRKQTERKAEHALFALRARPGQDEKSQGPSPTELLKVAQSHNGTSAAQRALLLAAAAMFDEQRYQEAQQRFEEFMAKYGNHPMAPMAALGIASCLDAQDKIEEAMSAYQRVINQFPAEPAAARARLQLAIIHEHKKQPEQALRLYEELNKPNVYGSVAAEAAKRREKLLQKHPQLAAQTKPSETQEGSTRPFSSITSTQTITISSTQEVFRPQSQTVNPQTETNNASSAQQTPAEAK